MEIFIYSLILSFVIYIMFYNFNKVSLATRLEQRKVKKRKETLSNITITKKEELNLKIYRDGSGYIKGQSLYYNSEIILDDINKKIYLADHEENYKVIDYDKIIGAEIFMDEKSSGGIGRALVGGFLAGGSGAIVGSLSAPVEITSLYLYIYINDISDSKYVFDLKKSYELNFRSDNPVSLEKIKFMRNVISLIKVIVENNKNGRIEKTETISTQNSVKESLEELKKLFDLEIITEEEYNKKRSEILDRL